MLTSLYPKLQGRMAEGNLQCPGWVIHVIPAIPACPVRPKSGHCHVLIVRIWFRDIDAQALTSTRSSNNATIARRAKCEASRRPHGDEPLPIGRTDVIAQLEFEAAPQQFFKHLRHRVLGWWMLVMTLIPIGDAVVVLRSGGSKATAYGVHVATAVVMAVIGILLLV